MKIKRSQMVVALLFVVAALAAGCGSDGDSKDSAAAGNPHDRAFVANMVPHHRSAIEMAAIAKTEATSPFVKRLAASIASTQKAEIDQMKRVDRDLAAEDIAKGKLGMSHAMMGMDMDAGTLRGAKPFDAEFISMMVPHHEGALVMARAELSHGKNDELKKLARHILTSQQQEIDQMRARDGGASEDPGMDQMNPGHTSR